MAEKTEKKDAAAIVEAATKAADNGATAERAKVAPGMRPLFAEVARLSATLSIARNACYEGDAAKAVRALELLAKQTPQAIELAGLLVPAEQ